MSTFRRFRGPAIAAAAMAVALAIGIPMLLLRGGGNGRAVSATTAAPTTAVLPTTTEAPPTTAEPTTTAAVTTTTTIPPMPPALAMTWEQVPAQEAFGLNDFIWSVVEGGPGLVAVGGVSDTPGEFDSTDGAVWVSEDGSTWERAGDPEVLSGVPTAFGTDMNQVLDGVVAGPAGIVATGWADTDTGDLAPPLWFSSDGLTWSRLSADDYPDGPENAPGGSVFAVDGGFQTVRVGRDLWGSADGREWTLVADAGSGVPENVHLAGAASGAAYPAGSTVRGGPGLVAVGTVAPDCVAGNCSGYPLAFVSSDGTAWSEVSLDLPGSGLGFLDSLSTAGDLLIAAGHDESGCALWTSTDGIVWSRSGTVAARSREMFLLDVLVLDDGRMLAAGFEYLGSVAPIGAAVVFGSADGGDTWYEVLFLDASDEGPYQGANDQRPPGIRDLIELDGKILAVGATGNGSAPVWIGTWDEE